MHESVTAYRQPRRQVDTFTIPMYLVNRCVYPHITVHDSARSSVPEDVVSNRVSRQARLEVRHHSEARHELMEVNHSRGDGWWNGVEQEQRAGKKPFGEEERGPAPGCELRHNA